VVGLFFFQSIIAVRAEKAPLQNKKIEEEREELKRLKRQILGQQEKTFDAKRREKSILSTLEGIDQRYRMHQKTAARLALEIKKNDDQSTGLLLKINELNKDVKNMQAVISKRLSTIYQARQSRGLRVLLASQDYSDFLRRLYYLRTIAKKEGALLVRFKEKKSQLDEKNRQLGETQEHLIKNKKSLGEQLIHIRAEKKKKSRLLSRVQNKRASYEEVLAELNQASHQLQDIIERLEKNKNRLKKRFSGKFSRKKGQLSWPNDGNVVSLFGRQKHPKFDTTIDRKGIEILPTRGEDVRAIFDGVVIFANWFRGYGMVIIIDHGENYYSIYAHLSKLLISVGDRIRKDRMIAEIGGTGFSQRNKLYLEIRHQGKPMDPLTWLRKRR